MGSYNIVFRKSAEKELLKHDPKIIESISNAIDNLAEDPFPVGYRKLKGSEKSFRIRVGDYRIVYQVDIKQSLITIFRIRHRKDVYR